MEKQKLFGYTPQLDPQEIINKMFGKKDKKERKKTEKELFSMYSKKKKETKK